MFLSIWKYNSRAPQINCLKEMEANWKKVALYSLGGLEEVSHWAPAPHSVFLDGQEEEHTAHCLHSSQPIQRLGIQPFWRSWNWVIYRDSNVWRRFTIIFPSRVVAQLFAVSFETLRSAHIQSMCQSGPEH